MRKGAGIASNNISNFKITQNSEGKHTQMPGVYGGSPARNTPV